MKHNDIIGISIKMKRMVGFLQNIMLAATAVSTVFIVPTAYAEDNAISEIPSAQIEITESNAAIQAVPTETDSKNAIPALTLEEYRKNAVNNNHEAQEMRYLYLAAKETKKMAFTKYFPQAVMGGIFGDTNIIPGTLDISLQGMNITNLFEHEHNGGILWFATAVQPLYMGRRIVNGNKLAKIGEDAAYQQLKMKENEVSLESEKKFRLVQLLERKMETVIAFEKLLDSLDSMVSQALKNGLCSKTDYLRVQLKKKEVSVRKEQLRKLTAIAKREMKVYAGISPEDDFTLSYNDELPQKPDYSIDALQERVPERPEYKLLVMNVQAAGLMKKIKKGEYLPKLIAGAAVYRSDSYIENKFSESAGYYNDSIVYAAMAVPLSGWWEASHTVKELKYKEDAAKKKLSDLDKYLLLDLENKLTSLETAYDEFQMAEIGLEMAQANRAELEDGYNNGTVTMADYLQALAEEHNESDNLEETRNKYFQARTDFLNAAGR